MDKTNSGNKNKKNGSGSISEIDKFWDVGSLLPKSGAKPPRASYGYQIHTALIADDSPGGDISQKTANKIPAKTGRHTPGHDSSVRHELPREEKRDDARHNARETAREIIRGIEQKYAQKEDEAKIIGETVRVTGDIVHDTQSPQKKTSIINNHPQSPQPPVSARQHIVKKYIPPHSPPAVRSSSFAEEYSPESGYIRKVIIYNWPSGYSFYDRFRRDALAYRDAAGQPCAAEQYFSYIPQYSQLNSAQLDWYLYWRDLVRAGEYPKTDLSYIMLYIYEIINLSDEIPPAEGRDALCKIWCAYRSMHPNLDKYLVEWVCDYSLIHRLPPPAGLLGSEDDYFVITRGAALREYYLGSGADKPGSVMRARSLIEYSSGYDWRKSKYSGGENRGLYKKHIYAAMAYVLDNLMATAAACDNDSAASPGGSAAAKSAADNSGNRSVAAALLRGDGLQPTRLLRDAYNGSLCVHNIKKRIEVEYLSLSRTHELRFLVTDIIKYSENKIRAYLGVKSRLGLFALSTGIRSLIDDYFSGVLPAKPRGSTPAAAPPPEYERLYDLPETEISAERAAEIERESWGTTYKLITAFGNQPESAVTSDGGCDARADGADGFADSDNIRGDNTDVDYTGEVETDEIRHEAGDLSDENDENEDNDDFPSLLYKALSDRGLLEFIAITERLDKSGAAEQRKFAGARGEMLDFIADEINNLAAELAGDVILWEDDGVYRLYETYREMIYGK